MIVEVKIKEDYFKTKVGRIKVLTEYKFCTKEKKGIFSTEIMRVICGHDERLEKWFEHDSLISAINKHNDYCVAHYFFDDYGNVRLWPKFACKKKWYKFWEK